MKDLIEALMIFQKYTDTKFPTNCSHDQLKIMDVGENDPSEAEKKRLEKLGFSWSDIDEAWVSFLFGSA